MNEKTTSLFKFLCPNGSIIWADDVYLKKHPELSGGLRLDNGLIYYVDTSANSHTVLGSDGELH